MNVRQLHAHAAFYRERAVCAERDQDFELLLDLATTVDAMAHNLKTREAGGSEWPRHQTRPLRVGATRQWLHEALARCAGFIA